MAAAITKRNCDFTITIPVALVDYFRYSLKEAVSLSKGIK